mmetsp:Transcript_21885/g.70458  ORF Transcript_21885/g.70458 Transcript_21885/m.70458 type:complete len:1167 (-) Transcript_21885:418-3918(-)|eukprot:CAMPEP_0118891566 /NCGR_PEP_ID=MMETSP1166-20130328/1533_1 /TAXON_ID=1104430 /ORGANISM="Chrysoreinhardia sp, Strain CCMP3193" /LENGTH=1166 /DNA_ID=CAMNT_0006830235 /DNA_START=152 /DNA_END=3652 /DNA_ORIENTATION=+
MAPLASSSSSPASLGGASGVMTTMKKVKWWSSFDEGRIFAERKQMLKLLANLLMKSKGEGKTPLMARRLEESLLRSSESLESYKDPKTLRDRLRQIAKQAKARQAPVTLLETLPRTCVEAHLRSLQVDRIRDRSKKILEDLCKRHKGHWLFLEPVDPVKLGVPTYFDVVRRPMDLATIRRRLDRFEYERFADVVEDCKLMFDNAILFNGSESQIAQTAREMRADVVDSFATLCLSSSSRGDRGGAAALKAQGAQGAKVVPAVTGTKEDHHHTGHHHHHTTTTSGEGCSLCGRDRLKLTALAYRCDGPGCEGQRVRKGAACFFDPVERRRYCRTCFDKLGLREENFVRERAGDDDDAEEPWVQCERCKSWVHQVCGLFNVAANSANAVYHCPNCTCHHPSAEAKGWKAKDIDSTALSRDLEARVRALWRQETQGDAEDEDLDDAKAAAADRGDDLESSEDSSSEANDDDTNDDVSSSSSNSATIASEGDSSSKEAPSSSPPPTKKLKTHEHASSRRRHEEGGNHRRREPAPLPKGGDLIVREVATTTEEHAVKPKLLKKLREADPLRVASYEATSRCVALFQEIDGIDVLLLALYVYEYGADAPKPNRRRLYVSYLDSVSYLRPKTARTAIYRSILVGYLADAKRRGFHTAHIWACPPKRGDDYIFHAKPKHQRVPTDDRLRKWYAAALDQARVEGVVGKVTTFYEDHLAPLLLAPLLLSGSAGSGAGDAANDALDDDSKALGSLPHFEGDYWPAEVERLFDAVEKEAAKRVALAEKREQQIREGKAVLSDDDETSLGGDSSSLTTPQGPPRKKSKKTHGSARQRAVLAPAKNVVVARLSKTMQAMKDSFLVAHLEPRALAAALDEQVSSSESAALPSSEQQQQQQQRAAAQTTTTTGSGRDILRTRQHFLDVCQGNHYQFDELRRAKHATMMVLFHFHHPTAPLFPTTCAKCGADVPSGAVCRQCSQQREPRLLRIRKPSLALREAEPGAPEANAARRSVLARVVTDDGGSDASDSGSGALPPRAQGGLGGLGGGAGSSSSGDRAELRRGLMTLLDHASTCQKDCAVAHCAKMKQQLEHFARCRVPTRQDQCRDCRRIFTLLAIHARQCQRPDGACPVRFCADFKKRARRAQQQSTNAVAGQTASGGALPSNHVVPDVETTTARAT